MTGAVQVRFTPYPTWRPHAAYWYTVGRCVLWGPLIGGLPFNWTIILIPFSYFFGALPAFLGGLCYAFWLHTPARRRTGRWERMFFGAVCGLLGALGSFGIVSREFLSVSGSLNPIVIGCSILGGVCVAAFVREEASNGSITIPHPFQR